MWCTLTSASFHFFWRQTSNELSVVFNHARLTNFQRWTNNLHIMIIRRAKPFSSSRGVILLSLTSTITTKTTTLSGQVTEILATSLTLRVKSRSKFVLLKGPSVSPEIFLRRDIGPVGGKQTPRRKSEGKSDGGKKVSVLFWNKFKYSCT